MAKSDKASSIDEVEYFTKTGVVLDSRSSSTTHVHGGGGQNNTAVRISSSTTNHLHLFVRQDNGNEFDTRFDDLDVAVRTGHRVSVVYAGLKSSKKGYSTGLVVHDTDRSGTCRNTANSLVKRFNSLIGAAMVIFIPFIIAPILGNQDNWGYYWLFCVIGISIFLFTKRKHSDSVRDAIVNGAQAEIDKAIEQEKSRASAA